MKALVLSGGGAKGAFQLGVITALWRTSWRPDLYFGVSVGALIAALLGNNKLERLQDIWVGEDRRGNPNLEALVHHRYPWWKVLWRIARNSLGVYDNTPLFNTLKREMSSSRISIRVGYVSLVNGEYVSAIATPTTTFASATMPVVWPPLVRDFVDGGLRNQTPLGEAIKSGATEIIVILTSNPDFIDERRKYSNIIDVARRSLEIAMNEISRNDIRETLRINDLVRQATEAGITLRSESGRALKHINIRVIIPTEPLGGTLDFDPESVLHNYDLGLSVGLKEFQNDLL